MSILDSAREYHRQGLQVIPLAEREKIPLVSWKEYQFKRQSETDLLTLFPDDKRNIGIIGGAISDNFFCLDFDNIEAYQKIKPTISKIINNTI